MMGAGGEYELVRRGREEGGEMVGLMGVYGAVGCEAVKAEDTEWWHFVWG